MDLTTLYRAVMPAEYDDLRLSWTFQNPRGIEVKYFSETAEGATHYARLAHRAFGDGPFTLVETQISEEWILPEMRVKVDQTIATVVVPTELLPQLSPPIIWPYLLLIDD